MLDTLGTRIEKVQLDNKLTGRDFCEKVNCGYHAFSMYKMDSRIPPLHFIINMCKAFDLDANWLLFGEKKEDGK